ncbi:MAG TPA: cyclase family protein [Acidimicrobiia bacterium]|jgi:kynurenine formamidase
MPLSEYLQQLAASVSNRGRWGADDRRGTLNLIDAAAVLRGIAAVRTGTAMSLAIPFDENGPQDGMIPGRSNPEREMLSVNVSMTGDADDFTTSDDKVVMGVQAATHWDALGHVGYGHELYNGVADTTNDEQGAHELGVERYGPIVSRGVLLDVARLHGVDHFDDGYPITGDDLDGCATSAGITVESGDVVLVRTGQMHWLREGRRSRYSHPSPGLSTQSITWLHDHDVAAVATDTIVFEVFPCEDPAVLLPVHMIHLRDMGLVQGQNFALDAFATACAEDGQADCLLVATPLPLTRALGGPVAPTAIR